MTLNYKIGDLPKSTLTKRQSKTYDKSVSYCGAERLMRVTVRYDDRCGNGHNTFSVTAEIGSANDPLACGVLRDEIREFFPELSHLLKWHLVSSEGPLHYVANTLYHASDRDCNGLRKGEQRQLRNGRTGKAVWEIVVRDMSGYKVNVGSSTWEDSDDEPEHGHTVDWEPVMIEGEGSTPDIEAARSSAVWPEATLEQLQDEGALVDRLPALMEDFKATVESIGFVY